LLGNHPYQAMIVRDDPGDPATEKIEHTALSHSDSLAISL